MKISGQARPRAPTPLIPRLGTRGCAKIYLATSLFSSFCFSSFRRHENHSSNVVLLYQPKTVPYVRAGPQGDRALLTPGERREINDYETKMQTAERVGRKARHQKTRSAPPRTRKTDTRRLDGGPCFPFGVEVSFSGFAACFTSQGFVLRNLAHRRSSVNTFGIFSSRAISECSPYPLAGNEETCAVTQATDQAGHAHSSIFSSTSIFLVPSLLRP